MYLSTCVRLYCDIHACIHVCESACMHACMLACLHACFCIFDRTRIRTCTLKPQAEKKAPMNASRAWHMGKESMASSNACGLMSRIAFVWGR